MIKTPNIGKGKALLTVDNIGMRKPFRSRRIFSPNAIETSPNNNKQRQFNTETHSAGRLTENATEC